MPTDRVKDRYSWLEEAILEYIRNNNGRKDSFDLVSYFKIRADITLTALGYLSDAGRIEKSKGVYRIKGEDGDTM